MEIHIEVWQEVTYVMSDCDELQEKIKNLEEKIVANNRMINTLSAELRRSRDEASRLSLEVFALRSKYEKKYCDYKSAPQKAPN